MQLSRVAGTTTSVYAAFMAKIVDDPFLGVAGMPGFVSRTFMHDNLASHLDDEVTHTITHAGHKVQQRPPYNLDDAPIEYQFNHIECEMRLRVHNIHTDQDLVREIHRDHHRHGRRLRRGLRALRLRVSAEPRAAVCFACAWRALLGVMAHAWRVLRVMEINIEAVLMATKQLRWMQPQLLMRSYRA